MTELIYKLLLPSGEDFTIATGNFTLNPGSPPLELSVIILEDNFVENDEQWTVVISQPDNAFPSLTILFTIVDNDRMSPQYTHFLSYSPLCVCVCRCNCGVC